MTRPDGSRVEVPDNCNDEVFHGVDADGRYLGVVPRDQCAAVCGYAPPDADRWRWVDGAWAYDPPLSYVQSQQRDLIDAAYFDAISAPVTYADHIFQADSGSQDTLLKATVGFDMLGGVPDGFFWKALDNTPVPFTLSDLHELYRVMLLRGQACFVKRTQLKAQIAAATTVAEVEAITWGE